MGGEDGKARTLARMDRFATRRTLIHRLDPWVVIGEELHREVREATFLDEIRKDLRGGTFRPEPSVASGTARPLPVVRQQLDRRRSSIPEHEYRARERPVRG